MICIKSISPRLSTYPGNPTCGALCYYVVFYIDVKPSASMFTLVVPIMQLLRESAACSYNYMVRGILFLDSQISKVYRYGLDCRHLALWVATVHGCK